LHPWGQHCDPYTRIIIIVSCTCYYHWITDYNGGNIEEQHATLSFSSCKLIEKTREKNQFHAQKVANNEDDNVRIFPAEKSASFREYGTVKLSRDGAEQLWRVALYHLLSTDKQGMIF